MHRRLSYALLRRASVDSRPKADPAALEDITVWASVKQMISARKLIGQRAKFSCLMRADGIGDAGYPFVRVDNRLGQKQAYIGWWEAPGLSLSGTTEWSTASLVVEVTDMAATIEFGISLSGFSGTLSACDIAFGPTDEPATLLHAVAVDGSRNLALA